MGLGVGLGEALGVGEGEDDGDGLGDGSAETCVISMTPPPFTDVEAATTGKPDPEMTKCVPAAFLRVSFGAGTSSTSPSELVFSMVTSQVRFAGLESD